MSDAESFDSAEGVAVVGAAGRFPGAESVEAFWELLRGGREGLRALTAEELLEAGVRPEHLGNPDYVRVRGTLEGADLFDAAFFGYTPREAEVTDPQQRLFLECAWEALEHAGCDPARFPGRVGVYAGATMNTYLHSLNSFSEFAGDVGAMTTLVGNDKDFLSTRVSYKLNLKGPGVTVQTACSTSLVAVHLACQSLLSYQCDMAMAGGVSVVFPQASGYLYQEGGILSPDGHCRAFDARAGGTVMGSGVGIVVLKRMEDALADGDTIYAVIRGSAINNDGSEKVGYTAPSVGGQAEAIAEAQALAGVSPDTVTYVEAHGTGTELGDPIEVAALTQAFRRGTERRGYCALGSVKSNVGHLDTAAGVTGLIKTVLALHHREIPPSLHFERPNPALGLEGSPFYVNTRLRAWERGDAPRRAGVSSFGIGGTNVHVVLEEAPPRAPSPADAGAWRLLVLSARTEEALEEATDRLAGHLEAHPGEALADVAYTLQVGRRAFERRRALVCRDHAEAIRILRERDERHLADAVAGAGTPPVVFLFPGGGAQYVDMARQLYRDEPFFRAEVDRCAEILRPQLGLDIRAALYPAEERRAEASREMERTSVALPSLFVVEHALAQLWMHRGVQPESLIGHSMGEYVAATLAGVFSLEDALALVVLRGRLFERLPDGVMLSVPLPEAELAPLLASGLDVAAANEPGACVVSGPVEEVAALEAVLAGRGVDCRRIHIAVAAHSRMVEPILEEFRSFVAARTLGEPTLPFVSNVTGTWITAAQATDPGYWVRHLRQTVRFADGLSALLQNESRIFLEVGPGRTLSTLVRRQAKGRTIVNSVRHPADALEDGSVLLGAVGRLWAAGVPIRWEELHAPGGRRRLALPSYPFQRQRFWRESRARGSRGGGDLASGLRLPTWKQSIPPWPSPAEGDRVCVVFADALGIGLGLEARLREAGRDVVLVEAGEEFVRVAPGRYVLDPRNEEGYVALFRELHEEGRIPGTVAHLWSPPPGGEADPGVGAPRAAGSGPERGLDSVRWIASAFERTGASTPLRLVVVSSGIHAVVGQERICPERAALIAASTALLAEHPRITSRSIDVVAPDPRDAAALGEALAAEVAADSSDTVVAYRGRRRWTRALEPAHFEGELPGSLRPGGVYLVTGGPGGPGCALARRIAARVPAKLVFLAPGAHADPALAGLREEGVDVTCLDVDVCDREETAAAVARITETLGPVRGVVHIAEPLPGSGHARAVTGARVLDELFRSPEPDFFATLLSSTADGVAGSMTGAYLDALAEARAARGAHAVSVRWVATPEAEAVDALLRLLSSRSVTQAVVAPGGPGARRADAEPPGEAPSPAGGRPRSGSTSPATGAEAALARIWEGLLGAEQVGMHANFFELGGDSVIAIQVVSRAKQAGYRITTRDLFEHPTVAELARVAGGGPSVPERGAIPPAPAENRTVPPDFSEAGLNQEELDGLLLELTESLEQM